MIVSVHMAALGRRTLGLLARGRRPLRAPGLRYSEAAGLVPLAGKGPPFPPRGVILISSWEDDAALDDFLSRWTPPAGYHVRLRPTRVVGAWPDMPGLPAEEEEMDPAERAAILTLGRPRVPSLLRFARTSRGAEKLAVGHPAMVAGTAAARLPRFVATFSIWRSVAEMRDFTLGRPDGRHLDAIRADRAAPFHHQAAFVRFRPYAATGTWNGRDPLAA